MAISFKRKAPKPEALPLSEGVVSPPTKDKKPKARAFLKKKSPGALKIEPLKNIFINKTAFVLLIGDDGAILIFLRKGVVEGRWFAPEAKDEHFQIFQRAIQGNAKVPFLVFLDTLDQTYLQQNLPPVNKMGLGQIMKRRLKREFSNTEIKGSRLLGRENTKKEWLFQMIAADTTETIGGWLNWLTNLENRCLGIRLLPLEMESVMKALFYKTNPDQSLSPWLYLLSHQKVSGFRQIILRDGKMIFTRVGQTLQGVSDVIAGLVEQEITSTLEYIKRLGLKDASDIHLHVIASQDVLQLIDPTRTGIKSFANSTPHQAAELLSLVNATQSTDRYGDMVTASAAARVRKPTLNTQTKALKQLAGLHNGFQVIGVLAVLAVLGLVGTTGLAIYDAWNAYEKKEELTEKKQKITKDLASVQMEMAKITNIELIKDVMDVHNGIQKRALDPEPFMLRLSAAKMKLGPSFQFRSVDWLAEEVGSAKNGNAEEASAINASVEAVFTPEPRQSNEDIRRTTNAALEAIKPLFDGYKVSIELPNDMEPENNISLVRSEEVATTTIRRVVLTLKFTGSEKPKLAP